MLYFCILVKWGVIIKCYGGEKFEKMQYDPPQQLSTEKHELDKSKNWDHVAVLLLIHLSLIDAVIMHLLAQSQSCTAFLRQFMLFLV